MPLLPPHCSTDPLEDTNRKTQSCLAALYRSLQISQAQVELSRQLIARTRAVLQRFNRSDGWPVKL